MTAPATPREVGQELVDQLRAKMGPLLRNDDEARAMLTMLAMNPAVYQFAATLRTKEPHNDRP